MKYGKDLETFINENLQPTKEFNDRLGCAVNAMVLELQQNVPLNVKETVKGGSMGKGTAIKNNTDLDLVVFLNDFTSQRDANAKRSGVIKKIKDTLIRDPKRAHPESLPNYRDYDVKNIRSTPYAVTVEMCLHGDKHAVQVDILPAYDNIAEHGNLRQVYQEMGGMPTDEQISYSASLTQLQIDFIKPLPGNVKNLIRLVKHFNKSVTPNGTGGYPTSYLMELVVCYAWKKAGQPTSFNMNAAFTTVLSQLADGRLDFDCSPNYNSAEYHGAVQRTPGRPFVRDPANPFNNVCAKVSHWAEVSACARRVLSGPACTGVLPNPQCWETAPYGHGENNAKIQVFVKNLQGKTGTYEVHPSNSVLSLKKQIRLCEGLPEEQQRLMYNSKQLEDANTLASYGVVKESTIHLVARLRGG